MPENINPKLSDESKPFQERLDDVRTIVEENLRYTKSLYDANAGQEKVARGDFEEMLAENLELTKKIYKVTTKIHRHLFWQQIFGLIKIIIIVGSLAWGVYLAYPMLDSAIQTYQNLINLTGTKLPSGDQNLLQQLEGKLKQ